MRPRTIAITILITFILLPVALYWYFYRSKITSMVFENSGDSSYMVILKGSFKYKYFPLLDRAFTYQSICKKSCIFSPIPPLEYTVTITGTGYETISDSLTLEAGDIYKYKVNLVPSLLLIPIGNFFDITNKDESIGQTQGGKKVFLKRDGLNDTGLYIGVRDGPNFTFSLPVRSARLDASRAYLIVRGERSEQYIFSLDGQRKMIFPYEEPIDIVSFYDTWKIRTSNSVYELSDDIWKKNLRFTDYIDISPRFRIGYIDKSDQDKLSLANLPRDNSLFILLDRSSTEMRVIKKGKEIRGFFQYEGLPTVLDRDGTIAKVDITIE